MKYKCFRCMQYETSVKSRYIRHLKRKFPCAQINNISTQDLLTEVQSNNYTQRTEQSLSTPQQPNSVNVQRQITPTHSCTFCGKIYSTNSHMHRHMKTCKHRESSPLIQTSSKSLQELIQKSIDETLSKLVSKVGNVTTNNYYTQQINNSQIIINTHGCENLQYITQKYVNQLLGIPFGAVPKLLKEIHFNPDHPENCNIQITNRKQKWARVWEGEEWKLRYKKEVIRSMVDKGFNIIDEQFYNVHDHLEEVKKNRYKTFQQKFADNDKELHRTLETDIELIILNNSSPSV